MGVDVDPDVLRDHASALESGPIAMVKEAHSAAKEVGLGDPGIYGVLLQFVVPPVLEAWLEDAEKGIASASKFGGGIADALRVNADSYEETERGIAEEFSKAEEAVTD